MPRSRSRLALVARLPTTLSRTFSNLRPSLRRERLGPPLTALGAAELPERDRGRVLLRPPRRWLGRSFTRCHIGDQLRDDQKSVHMFGVANPTPGRRGMGVAVLGDRPLDSADHGLQ